MSLLDAFDSTNGRHGAGRDGLHDSKILGVAVGIVTDNRDPDGRGRVKLRLPRLTGDDESNWARVTTFMAGNDMGAVFIPEVDDEVLVVFEHGDVNLPYVIGSLHNGRDRAPYSNSDGLNKERIIKSKSGHVVRFDDSPGQEKIEIIDKTEDNKIVFDSSENKITIEAKGELELKLGDDGTFKMSAADLEFEAAKSIRMTSADGIQILSPSGDVVVFGKEIRLN